jgi:hypothetical protein
LIAEVTTCDDLQAGPVARDGTPARRMILQIIHPERQTV